MLLFHPVLSFVVYTHMPGGYESSLWPDVYAFDTQISHHYSASYRSKYDAGPLYVCDPAHNRTRTAVSCETITPLEGYSYYARYISVLDCQNIVSWCVFCVE